MGPAVSLELRAELEDLYRTYAWVLDNEEYEQWLDLFAADCFYQIIPRENYDRGLPLALMRCESKGMLEDRVYALRETVMFEPHYVRHLISGVRVSGEDAEGWTVEASYAVFVTRPNELSQVFNVGRYLDRVVREEGALRFARKDCVYDSSLVAVSIVTPI